jgi:fumarate hydratase class II
MPIEFIHAYATFKKCAARANYKLKHLDKKRLDIITKVCNEILDNKYNDEFPLHIWQTGSGTHTNMNVNEVIANICNKKLTGKLGTKTPIHPNNHVNMSQSSNDSFITVIHISVAILVNKKIIPNLEYMINGFKQKQKEFKDVIKIGRTHLEDAVPLTFGQEFSGYVAILEDSLHQIKIALKHIYELAAGGTAVGTGLNTPKNFDKVVVNEVSIETKLPFKVAENKFAEMSSHNAVLEMSDAFKVLATNIMKIANDIRWLGSGPKTGLGELILPQNEPGSSIMPGKVNPTQCEALTMLACQVIGNHHAITLGGMNGHFELNVFRPMIIRNILESINLINDGVNSFIENCLVGIIANQERITELLNNSLMLVTALNPYIGYDNSAKIAKKAHQEGTTLKQSALDLKLLSEQQFNDWIDPKKMT